MTGSRAETSEGRCEHGQTEQHNFENDDYSPMSPANLSKVCPGPVSAGTSEGRLTDEELAKIEARADAATAGPWSTYFGMHGDPRVVADARRPLTTMVVSTAPDDYGKADCEFIAAARSDVPRLLAAVRGQGEALQRAEAMLRAVHERLERSDWIVGRELLRLIDGPDACRHCGRLPEADGDHSCTCPYSDAECPDHPAPPLLAERPHGRTSNPSAPPSPLFFQGQ